MPSSDLSPSGELSLQDRFAPQNACFGCGAANPKGLRIKSFPAPDDPDGLVCDWTPEPHHQAFDGILNGGIVGAIFDCHMNWTAAWTLMRRDGLDHPPCTVTLEFRVRMRRPTPVDRPLRLVSRVVEIGEDRVKTEATLVSGDPSSKDATVTAICDGTFVAVKPGHPAYHRW